MMYNNMTINTLNTQHFKLIVKDFSKLKFLEFFLIRPFLQKISIFQNIPKKH